MKRLKVFIAGPLTAYGEPPHEAARVMYRNVREAIRVATLVLDKGHWPFIPHLTYYFHLEQPLDRGALYYDWDNAYLDVCDALVLIGPSPGADKEVERMRSQGKPVFTDVDDLPHCMDLPDDLATGDTNSVVSDTDKYQVRY